MTEHTGHMNLLNKHIENKLGSTFHRTFTLVRSAVAQILELAVKEQSKQSSSKCLTQKKIRQNTILGTIYVQAMPRYGRGCGLLDEGLCPTLFGKSAHLYDPLLQQSGTQWLMHYHLSAPHHMGPAFWYDLVATRFRSGDQINADEVDKQIARCAEVTEGKQLDYDSSIRPTRTAFLGSYTKSDALGELRILLEEGDGLYTVLEPEPPPHWAIAYAILDFWEAHFDQQVTINLSELVGVGRVTSILLIGPTALNNALTAMQEAGFVEVHRVAPPYQVVLLRRDRQVLLERLYGSF